MAQVAQTPAVRVIYRDKDISHEIAPYLQEATYTDRITGQSDELELTLIDPDGRWRGAWYPEKGDKIEFEYGYESGKLMRAGSFEIDQITLSGPPDKIRIQALAVGISRQARTRIGKAYELTNLRDIVHTIAKRLKAQVMGTIADIKITKATQFGEGDWVFLVRLCREYGYEVKLTDNNTKLVVAKLKGLASGGVVRVLRPADISSYSFEDKITDVPAKTEVRHYDPKKKKLVKGGANAGGTSKGKTSSDTRRRVVPAKTEAQARAIAEAEQERHEIDKTKLTIGLPGDMRLVAGASVTVVDYGVMNGTYMIIEARHPLGQSGYPTEIQCKRVGEK